MTKPTRHLGAKPARLEKGTRAAQYVRMSTDHQKYSTENQSDTIRRYAAERAIDIVKTYADAGKSGLNIDGRDALKCLIEDVESKRADFETILVTTLAVGGVSRTGMKALTTSTSASAPALLSNIVRNNFKMMEALSRRS